MRSPKWMRRTAIALSRTRAQLASLEGERLDGYIGDRLADRDRRRRARRRRVAHVEDAVAPLEDEVVDEAPVRSDGLRPDPGGAPHDVLGSQIGDQLAGRRHEQPAAVVAGEFDGARAPVAPGEPSESRGGERLEQVARANPEPPVARSREREHGARPEPDG